MITNNKNKFSLSLDIIMIRKTGIQRNIKCDSLRNKSRIHFLHVSIIDTCLSTYIPIQNWKMNYYFSFFFFPDFWIKYRRSFWEIQGEQFNQTDRRKLFVLLHLFIHRSSMALNQNIYIFLSTIHLPKKTQTIRCFFIFFILNLNFD